MASETRAADDMRSILFTLPMHPMLCIPEKKTKSVDLCDPLLLDINQKLSKRKVQVNEHQVRIVNERRSQLAKPPKEGLLIDRLHLLQDYFHDLSEIETHFSSPKDQINNVKFTWYEAFGKNMFKKKEMASHQSILLEKAAIIFNIGAVYSQIGQRENRLTVQGRREAVQAFRRAAGAFAHLKDKVAPEALMGELSTVDLSTECTTMLEKLMLAQVQECLLEIVVDREEYKEDHAKFSRQVASYYEEAWAALNVAPLKGHVDKGWISHVKLKAALFDAGARYKHALELDEKNEIGEEIAWLRTGISVLEEAKKSSKGGPAELFSTINKLEENINTSLNKAEKVRMCFMKGPPPNSLPALPSRSMVKQPITMDEVVGSRKDCSSAKALSRYTARVDGIVQIHKEKLQQSSEDIRMRLGEMDLPDSILAVEGHLSLLAYHNDVDEVQRDLVGLKPELQHLRLVNQELLVKTQQLLQTRPQPNTRTKSSQDQLNRIINDLKQAAENDAHVEHLVNYQIEHLVNHSAIPDGQQTESAFPPIPLDEKEVSRVKSLKKSLGELDTLGERGERLQRDLKHMKMKENILLKLSAFSGSQEDLFEEEISKYKPTCEKIDGNIVKRERLLSKIQDKNDRLFSFPKFKDYKALRQKFYGEVQAAIAKYQEIKEYIIRAKNFYATLQVTITNMTGNIPRREMIGLESDIYDQATSDLVAGSDLEGTIQVILELGRGTWDRGTVVHALDVAHNNPDRAVDFLYSGIPAQDEVPPAARVPLGAQAANPPAQPAQPAQSASGQLPSAMPQAVTSTPEEREAMERLEAMGFDRATVGDAYFSCNKDEQLAANRLLDHIGESKD